MTLGISNEKLWNQGLFYRGIHIGTKDDEITSEYDWWSYGRFEVEGGRWINHNAAPAHASTSQVHWMFARGLLRATLRNVKESVLPILDQDVKGDNRRARLRLTRYTIGALKRASQKYGRDSEQYRLLKAWTYATGSKEDSDAMVARQWAPSWETMMRLEQDQPELGPRKRLLRPRPPRTSTLTAGQRSRSKTRMKHKRSHDTVPEEADATSSAIEMASPRPTPRAVKPRIPTYQREGALSALDITPKNKAVSSEAEERGVRPVLRARRNRLKKKYIPQSFTWW